MKDVIKEQVYSLIIWDFLREVISEREYSKRKNKNEVCDTVNIFIEIIYSS